MTNLGVFIGVPIVCIIVVVVVVVVILLCMRWRRQKHSAQTYRNKENIGRTARSSSTVRSDKSDHPYEIPLPSGNLDDNHGNNNREPEVPEQYALLQGQSLPHHYQGLREKTDSSRRAQDGTKLTGDEGVYDELVLSSTSTGGANSDYYFKLESADSLRGDIGIRSDLGLDKSLSNPDKVSTGNPEKNVAETKEASRGTLESTASSPYYFKVDINPSDDSESTVKIATEEGKGVGHDSKEKKSSDIGSAKDLPETDSSKPHVVSEPDPSSEENEAMLAARDSYYYDRLDRTVLRQPKEGDDNRGSGAYNKLLPRLALESSGDAAAARRMDLESSGTYLKVKTSGNTTVPPVQFGDEETDYNRLDRGAEMDIRNNLEVSENGASPVALDYKGIDNSKNDMDVEKDVRNMNSSEFSEGRKNSSELADQNEPPDDAIPIEL